MVLKVIRYKNYGCTMTGGGDPEPHEHKFYFSFYELNIWRNYRSSFMRKFRR